MGQKQYLVKCNFFHHRHGAGRNLFSSRQRHLRVRGTRKHRAPLDDVIVQIVKLRLTEIDLPAGAYRSQTNSEQRMTAVDTRWPMGCTLRPVEPVPFPLPGVVRQQHQAAGSAHT